MPSDPPLERKRKKPRNDSAVFGATIAVCFIGFAQALLLVISSLPMEIVGDWPGMLFWWPGWTQMLYLPAYIILQRRRGFHQRAKGALVVGTVLFFITSACSALMGMALQSPF